MGAIAYTGKDTPEGVKWRTATSVSHAGVTVDVVFLVKSGQGWLASADREVLFDAAIVGAARDRDGAVLDLLSKIGAEVQGAPNADAPDEADEADDAPDEADDAEANADALRYGATRLHWLYRRSCALMTNADRHPRGEIPGRIEELITDAEGALEEIGELTGVDTATVRDYGATCLALMGQHRAVSLGEKAPLSRIAGKNMRRERVRLAKSLNLPA
jgi:hypothetical protein